MALGKGLGSLIKEEQENDNSNDNVRKTEETSPSTENQPKQEGKIVKIKVSNIVPNRSQPRESFPEEKLQELVESIKKHGVMQPVTVTPLDDGEFELIAGERRTRASKKAGLDEIPAIIRSVTNQEKIELALIENIQREDLNPVEEALAYQRLKDEFDLTQQEVAERVGKGRSTVANMIRLLNLPDKVQQALREKTISMGKARALLSLEKEAEIIDAFEDMIGEKISVREVEDQVAEKTGKTKKKKKDPNILAKEEELEEKLGTKVNIKKNKKGEGSLEIDFYSVEELKRIINRIT